MKMTIELPEFRIRLIFHGHKTNQVRQNKRIQSARNERHIITLYLHYNYITYNYIAFSVNVATHLKKIASRMSLESTVISIASFSLSQLKLCVINAP